MSADSKAKVVKKIAPYPFVGEMLSGPNKISINVVMISTKGLVAQIRAGICYVGTQYQCQIYLPQNRDPIQIEGKVFKTFDHFPDPRNIKKIERRTEVVFMNLSDDNKAKITSFMEAIGQK